MVRRIRHESSSITTERKTIYTRDCFGPLKVPFFTHAPELYVCCHALVATSLPNWIVDTGANKDIVRDQDDYVIATRWVHKL